MLLGALAMFSNDLAIDLGTANTCVFARGRGIVLSEPSIVAFNTSNAQIEAVGVPATFELATTLIRPGGHVANIGVHGTPATLHLEDLWIRNVTITTGLVDAYSTQTLLRLIGSGQLDAKSFVTARRRQRHHHFAGWLYRHQQPRGRWRDADPGYAQ